MDPIYYQVNQTRLTENTQKSSDNLRIQQNKESKKKAERAGEVDKSAVTADSSSMSDDMLGDMDPDDYGGRGAKQFAQMWKEQLAEERNKEKEEDSEDEDAEDQEEERQEPEDEQAPAKEEVPIAPVQAESAQLSLPPTSSPLGPGSAAAEAPVEEVADPEPAPDSPAQPPPPPDSNPSASPRAEAPTQQAPTRAQAGAAEQVELSTAAPAGEAAATRARSSLGSLLDFSSGFLIAEDAHWEATEEESESDAPEVAPEEPIDEDISVVLERLVSGDPSQPGFRKLNTLLARFGRRVLQQCQEAQTRVYLLPPGEPLLAHPQLQHCGYDDLQGAAYLPQQRLCLVEDSCLTRAPHGFHPLFFYFAHAFDHALGGENFASLKSPAVQASYQACLEGAHRFGDLMAAHSPAHYFAQAVESYLSENDCFEPLWTRQDLYDFDRSMYDYVEYLLRRKT